MAASKPKRSFEAMNQELDRLLAELQQEDIDVDKALTAYEDGLKLIEEIEAYLQTAETKVVELKARFDQKTP